MYYNVKTKLDKKVEENIRDQEAIRNDGKRKNVTWRVV